MFLQTNPIRPDFIYPRIFVILFSILLLPGLGFGQNEDSFPVPSKLKKLSLEELMDIEVTSVSKRSEKLSEAASAIQVITGDDIKRSGATNIPEALRLSPNLQVSQIKSNAWIISARGFNSAFPNKLLVLIDGRTVYSPLFAGVFWDAQSVLLEDVERIEVISGPGGTLWGANAVNGVINIITKSAESTKGWHVSAAAGSFLQYSAALRYSGKIGNDFSYRVYAQHTNYDNTYLADGTANRDSTRLSQTGFRVDWRPSAVSNLTILGNFYTGAEKNLQGKSTIDGQNILGRWTRTFSEKSELSVQAYIDRTWRRDRPSTISDQLYTYDFEFQHRFPIGKRHDIIWGGGFRFMNNEMQHSTPYVAFLPPKRNMNLFSGFIQDEFVLAPDKLKMTLGAKLQHNIFSGFEIQPNARLAWTPAEQHTIWAAVSRAIRAPSRIDVDYYIPAYPVPPTSPSVAGGPNFTSEKVIAYELGYRVRPVDKLAVSLAAFYNQYDDLYSVEAIPNTLTFQTHNGGKGYSSGVELSGNYQLLENWRLRGGYTYFFKKLKNKPGHAADYSGLGIDPENQFLVQSILNIAGNFQFDATGRYVSALAPTPYTPAIPDYFTVDARIAWQFKMLEIAVVGRHLLQKEHTELISTYIRRNFYVKITCQF